MDPLTQASLGAAAAAITASRGSVRRALVVGAVAGAAPDLDVLIGSDTDPLLSLHFHRHFTHSLLFAPVIGLLVAALAKAISWKYKWPCSELLRFATLGALSHGLLDACTSYGTLLYLPISHHRESWDLISIIDPLFHDATGSTAGNGFCHEASPARSCSNHALLLISFLGYIQRERAENYAISLAESRELAIDRVTARPSFANILLWRIIVRSGDRYSVDAVSLIPWREPRLPRRRSPRRRPESIPQLRQRTGPRRPPLRPFLARLPVPVPQLRKYFLGTCVTHCSQTPLKRCGASASTPDQPDEHVEI